VDPVTLKLYKGDVSAKAAVDVRKDIPKSNARFRARNIQVGPLLRDLLKKDFMEGTFRSSVAIRMAGYGAIVIKGNGDTPLYLAVHGNRVYFRDASSLWGMESSIRHHVGRV